MRFAEATGSSTMMKRLVSSVIKRIQEPILFTISFIIKALRVLMGTAALKRSNGEVVS